MAEPLTRRLTPLNLLLISVNGMLGSAWLFAPLYVAQMAGPLSLWAWGLGTGMTLLVAWCFAKLSAVYPVAGGTAQLPRYTHGALTSFMIGWLGWWSALAMAPIEVQAVLQYLHYFVPVLIQKQAGVPVLTPIGMMAAVLLLAFLGIVNIWSLQGLVRINRLLFAFKVGVMLMVIGFFSSVHLHAENFVGAWVVSPGSLHAVLSAVALGGIAFAFTGFKHGVELAAESHNPKLAMPLAIMGSVVVCALLYMGLQATFIGALDPALLKNGWSALSFAGDFGPLAGLAVMLGLTGLVTFLYWDAVVSPLGAGLIYTSSTARIVYGMAEMGCLPACFLKLNRSGLPYYAVALNLGLGFLLFLPLPGWQALIGFLISGMVLSYGIGPIILRVMVQRLPYAQQSFSEKITVFLCPLAFYACNLIAYWAGWATFSKLAVVIVAGLLVFLWAAKTQRLRLPDGVPMGWRSMAWLLTYLGGLTVHSYLGSFGEGLGIIPFGWDFLTMGIFSLFVFYSAVRAAEPAELVHGHADEWPRKI